MTTTIYGHCGHTNTSFIFFKKKKNKQKQNKTDELKNSNISSNTLNR